MGFYSKAKTLVCAAAFAAAAFHLPAQAQTQEVDLALVLAVDCSGSVDEREFELQRTGIAQAFRDPAVIAAATAGPAKRIAVKLVFWADQDLPSSISGWYEIASPADAAQLAEAASRLMRPNEGGRTGLGEAIRVSVAELKAYAKKSLRRVIDVSGDGQESWDFAEPRYFLRNARVLVRTENVTVNGLAITTDVPDLDAYYRDEVIGGAGAFVIKASSYDDFAQAMRIKLLRELQPETASLD